MPSAMGQQGLDESTGFTKKAGRGLTWLAQNLDTVMRWLKRIAEVGLAVLIYRLIPALITAWQTAGRGSTRRQCHVGGVGDGEPVGVGGGGQRRRAQDRVRRPGAFLVGWEIGTWLSEKFEIVRKAGIFMVEMLMKGIEQLQYRWEVSKPYSPPDTIERPPSATSSGSRR